VRLDLRGSAPPLLHITTLTTVYWRRLGASLTASHLQNGVTQFLRYEVLKVVLENFVNAHWLLNELPWAIFGASMGHWSQVTVIKKTIKCINFV